MNPNEMIYFNALVVQRDFHEEARRAREAESNPERPAEGRAAARPKTRTRTKGHDHKFLGLLGLSVPGRR